MSKPWRVFSVVVAAILAGYFVWFAASRLDLAAAAAALHEPNMLVAMLAATVSYMLIYPFTGAAWSILLRRQSVHCSTGRLTQLISFTQISRYVPGNIAQHIGRALLGIKRGIPARAYVVSVLQETGLTVCASMITGAAMLAASEVSLAPRAMPTQWLVYVAASICGVVVVLACLDVAPGRRGRNGLRERLVEWMGGTPGFSATWQATLCYIGNYLAAGLGLWMIARALGVGHEIGFAFATAVFSLSWVLGFLVPGAPAGLGAREGVMVLVLQGHGTDEQVVLLTLLARAASMLGDVLAFLASLYFMHGDPKDEGNPV